MEIVAIDSHLARCRVGGVGRQVSLFLLQDEPPIAGDFVTVHVGCAIQKMTVRGARSAWELCDELLAAEGGEGDA